MRITRSASRKAYGDAEVEPAVPAQETATIDKKASPRKRKAASDPGEPIKKPRATKATAARTPTGADAKKNESAAPTAPMAHVEAVPAADDDGEALVPAVLAFSFDEARTHLVGTDPRFADVFRKCKCKPFEELERVDPFRCVWASILGLEPGTAVLTCE